MFVDRRNGRNAGRWRLGHLWDARLVPELASREFGTLWNTLGHFGMPEWAREVHHRSILGTLWDTLGHFGTFWDTLGQRRRRKKESIEFGTPDESDQARKVAFGTLWDTLGRFGTL